MLNPQVVIKKYNIPQTIPLNIEISERGWFLVTSDALPGLITQARNPKELLPMVNDAILTYYDVPAREAKEIFNSISIEGLGVITSKNTSSFGALIKRVTPVSIFKFSAQVLAVN